MSGKKSSPDAERLIQRLKDNKANMANLKNCPLSDALVEALSECKSITKLVVPGTSCITSVQDILKVSEVLRNNPNIHKLSLHEGDFGDELFEHLVPAIGESKGLNWVNLSKNKLGVKSMKALGSALATNKTIKELIFTLNWFKDEGFEPICEMLEVNKGLESIEITRCGITMPGAKRLVEALNKNTSLRYIKLRVDRTSKTDLDVGEYLRDYIGQNFPNVQFISEGKKYKKKGNDDFSDIDDDLPAITTTTTSANTTPSSTSKRKRSERDYEYDSDVMDEQIENDEEFAPQPKKLRSGTTGSSNSTTSTANGAEIEKLIAENVEYQKKLAVLDATVTSLTKRMDEQRLRFQEQLREHSKFVQENFNQQMTVRFEEPWRKEIKSFRKALAKHHGRIMTIEMKLPQTEVKKEANRNATTSNGVSEVKPEAEQQQ